MKVTWLHISDFHIRGGDPYDRDVVLRSLIASVKQYRERGRQPDLIFATGDIAYSGKAAEYEIASQFFDALLDAVGLERHRLFVIPGNHDIDRDMGIGLTKTLDTREQADSYFAPGVPKPHLTQKLSAFIQWYNRYFEGIRQHPETTTCAPVEVEDVRGCRIAVLPLNSALFCQGDDDHGRLCIGRRCLDPALASLRDVDAHVRVALVHHPLEWLSDLERSNIRASLQQNADVILRGHLHETDVESVLSTAGGALHIAAGATYQTRRWPNRALYTTVDDEDLFVFPIRYEDQPREIWTVDPSVFPDEPTFEGRFPLPRSAALAAVGAVGPVQSTEAPAAPPRFRSNLPSRGDLPFVGRDALLEEILASLGDPLRERVLVLHGPPGVGKSELAREFARRHGGRYPGGTFFIDAAGGAELVDLARIGANHLDLSFPPGLSLQDQCERTLLSFTIPVLLVYDNAHSLESVQPWLPRARMPCHVLITSVSERWGLGWPCLEVPPLTEEKSLQLIDVLAGSEVTRRYGKALAALAGGLPVQIAPAAATLAYEARRGRLDTVKLTLTEEAQDSFRLVYERIEEPVKLLLHAVAFFNGQRIPRDEIFRHLGSPAGWSEEVFRQWLDVCLDLHLLEGGAELRMHQLFAAFVRGSKLSTGIAVVLGQVRRVQRTRLVELAQELAVYPANPEMAAALLVFPLRPDDWQDQPISLSEGEVIAHALLGIGKYEEARPWFERAVKGAEQGDAPGVDRKKSLHHVGLCLLSVGKHEQALLWLERAVKEAQQGDVHGSIDHDSLGRSLHTIGYCLSGMGRYEEARSWYERAVEEVQQGDPQGRVHHAALGSSLHQVGFCLSSVGRYEEALPWCERAVEQAQQGDINTRVDNASVARSMSQVGFCLWSMGKYEEARPWYERAVEIAQLGDVYGRIDHETLGTSLNQVGLCLSSVGRHEDALPWYERAVQEAEQGDVYGRIDNASVAISLQQVGFCLSVAGRYEEARPWLERAVEKAQHGSIDGVVDHSILGRTLYQIGFCLSSGGKYEEAIPWYMRAFEEMQQGDVHGRIDHSSLGRNLHQVGFCLSSMGRNEEARTFLECAVQELKQGDIHGRVDHATLGASLYTVGIFLASMGRGEEARPWFEHALDEAQKGDVHARVDHEFCGKCLHEIGMGLSNASMFEKAWPWFERAVEAKQQGNIYGLLDQASLAMSLESGAQCLRRIGDEERAKAWEQESLRSFGPKPE